MISEQNAVQAHVPAEGDLRINYIPQIPGKPFQAIFPVDTETDFPDDVEFARRLGRAAQTLDAIINFSTFEYDNRIKPDYSDMLAIERFQDGDWEDIDEEEWEQLL